MEVRTIEPVNTEQGWGREEINTIKRTVARGATDDELRMFLHLAKTYGLDPFAKDIWFIKDRTGTPIIMTSRDGYLKIANRDENYDGMDADVVYQGDKFNKLKDGVEHVYETKNRGNPIGAYAMVYRKDRSRPVYVYAPFSNYFRDTKVWRQYPHAMILKVAEAMALKRAFSISGLVTREEIEENAEPPQTVTVKAVQTEQQIEAATSNVKDLGEYKKKLYLAYLKLCGNSSNAAQHEMLKITQGRGSSQWTDADLRALVQDIEAKRKIIQQESKVESTEAAD
ncbi:MAG: phage recombination protein Bet [Synergistaceae bacterium]|nr:phage recombination protein Bet [Synergistaceae bacterium]MBR1604007.1 phage recombination protein Bet [Synergistaceae bacterium]